MLCSMSILLLEGPDGSGKTTVSKLIAQRAIEDGKRSTMVRDPGHTALGERLRDLCADKSIRMNGWAQTLCFSAARAQLCEQLHDWIEKKAYDLIILDRFWQSTIAYQCFGNGVPREPIMDISRELVKAYPHANIPLDLAFGLMLPLDLAQRRRDADDSRKGERMKAAPMDFKQRVHEGYAWLCSKGYLNRIDVSHQSADEVAAYIYAEWKRRSQ